MRVCAHCGKPIEHLRADARYCDSICRRDAARDREALSQFERPGAAQRFWRAYAQLRRAARRRSSDV